jgi:hypothetical protein
MNINRREFVQTTSCAALGTAMTSRLSGIAQTTATPAAAFDIDQAFADFMKDLGGGPSDGGGMVTFTGRDPILRSHFRIGSCMAIPAMAAGVGAAAIWKKRTGAGQDTRIDLREAIYHVNPAIGIIMQKKRAFGLFDPDDPIPETLHLRAHHQRPLVPGAPALRYSALLRHPSDKDRVPMRLTTTDG